MRINPLKMGLAAGVVCGIGAQLLALFALLVTGTFSSSLLVLIWPGFGVGIASVALALPYGFLDGFLLGWIAGLVYNRFYKSSQPVQNQPPPTTPSSE